MAVTTTVMPPATAAAIQAPDAQVAVKMLRAPAGVWVGNDQLAGTHDHRTV